MFQKGMKKTGGREKGVINSTTRSFKTVFTEVFHKMQEHPRANLHSWGLKYPTEFYRIAGRLIPTEIEGSINHKLIQIGYTDNLAQDSYSAPRSIEDIIEQKEIQHDLLWEEVRKD